MRTAHTTAPTATRRSSHGIAAVALAIALAGCAGTDDPVGEPPAASPTDTPSAAPASPTPDTNPTPADDTPTSVGEHVLLVTGGGCFDAAEPDCPVFVAAVPAVATAAIREGVVAPVAGEDPSLGCGRAFVDGVSIVVAVVDETGTPSSTPALGCLADTDPTDGDGAAALWDAYRSGASVVEGGGWTVVDVTVRVGGGCAAATDACPEDVVSTASDGPLFSAVATADLTPIGRDPLAGGPDPGGCGDAPTDGVGVLVRVERSADGISQALTACLEDLPEAVSTAVAPLVPEA